MKKKKLVRFFKIEQKRAPVGTDRTPDEFPKGQELVGRKDVGKESGTSNQDGFENVDKGKGCHCP